MAAFFKGDHPWLPSQRQTSGINSYRDNRMPVQMQLLVEEMYTALGVP